MNNGVFISIISLSLVLVGCTTPPPKGQGDACAIFEQHRAWYRITNKTERKWGAPIELQLAFIKKESSFESKARPERKKYIFGIKGRRLSSARGYAQALDGTWDVYKKSTGNHNASRKDFADASDFIGWYVHQTSKRTGLSKTDAYSQYLAYHEGAGGYLKGSWKKKPGVKRRASVVSSQTQKYQSQLRLCESKLKRNIPFVPFI